MDTRDVERTEVVIIGAGQTGLSVGYHLAKRGIPFVILEANDRVGDGWRKRWDSLRLFTPARYDGLVGMPFPAPATSFPTKDEMADYLEAYAARFKLPVETGVTVDHLSKRGADFVVSAGGREIVARQVVVAMASYQKPVVPAFARQLSPEIVQLHSVEYRRPSQLRDGQVLIVGAGNSGAEIAMEFARLGRPVAMSGRHPGHVPFDGDGGIGLHVFAPILLRFVFHRLLTMDTPMGRKANPGGHPKATPLIRLKPKQLAAAGVVSVPRITGVENGMPVLENGQTFATSNVVWCTGFQAGFSWIDLPVFDERAGGAPIHRRGIVEREPGLYFIGLHFLYAMSSPMIHGAARDAAYIARAIGERAALPADAPLAPRVGGQVGLTRSA